MVDIGSGAQKAIRSKEDHALFNKSTQQMKNNKSVRKTLLSRGIVPENLPPEEDVKKLERKLKSEEEKSLKENKGFNKTD